MLPSPSCVLLYGRRRYARTVNVHVVEIQGIKVIGDLRCTPLEIKKTIHYLLAYSTTDRIYKVDKGKRENSYTLQNEKSRAQRLPLDSKYRFPSSSNTVIGSR